MPYPKKIDPQAMVDGALEIIRRDGWAALSMRQLAAELGVRASSLYRHFASREDLEHALAESAAAKLRERMELASEGLDVPGTFRAVAGEYVAFAKDEPALFELLMSPGARTKPPVEGKRLWNLILRVVGAVTGRADDTAAAVAVWSFLHGFAMLAKTGQFGASGPKQGYEVGLEALRRGLSSRTRGAGTSIR
jgi:AcrR family transcriptional regulator